MSGAMLLFGHARHIASTKRWFDTVIDFFDGKDVVIHLFGIPSPKMEKYINNLDTIEVIWDYKLDNSRSNQPDLRFLSELEDQLGESVFRRCIRGDRKLIKNGLAGVFNYDTTSYTDTELRSHVEVRARKLKELFTQYEFDFVLGPSINYFSCHLSYYFCELHNVKFFRVAHTRIKNHYTVHENPWEYSPSLWEQVDRARDDLSQFSTVTEAREVISTVRDGKSSYTTVTTQPDEYTQNKLDNLLYYFETIIKERGGVKTKYYGETPNIRIIYEEIRNKIRGLRQQYNGDFDPFNKNENYVYFPLQVQPEASLMIWAPFYADLDHTVKHLARSLPIDYSVNVNEHPMNVGVRKTSYYSQLQAEPNVYLMNKEVSTRELIRNADLTVTVTSTAGLESLMCGTPVVTFGQRDHAPFYANLNGVYVADLTDGFESVLQEAIQSSVDKSDILAYTTAALQHGISRNNNDFIQGICGIINSRLD